MTLYKIALVGSIVIYTLCILFHLLVLIKLIPYKMVWGGRLKTNADMYKFELVSLLLNVVFLFISLIKANYFSFYVSTSFLNSVLWIMAILFLVNSVGNLLSKTKLEKTIFTPLTILLTLFSVVLALER